jgi:hypothetical protein
VKSQNTTLSGWVTSINEGDIMAVNVDSAAAVQRLCLALRIQRS